MRILLIVNTFASSVTARNTVMVRRRLGREHDVEVRETNRRGHATRFAADAARRGVDVAVGFGGDGTLNEVATGIAGTACALGVLPGGSTNVFARTLGMKNDPIAAVDQLARGISSGTIRPVGLGQANGRFFCFHAGIGFDAAVVAAVERRASLKRWLGHPLFLWAAMTTWWSGYDRNTPHFRLSRRATATTDLEPRSTDVDPTRRPASQSRIEDGYFSIVLNTNPYTYLGNRPLDLSAAATLDRALVVMTFRTLDPAPMARGILAAFRGKVTADEHLVEWTDVTQLDVVGERVPYQLDGDYVGAVPRLDIAYVPNAINLVVPDVATPTPQRW